MLILVVKISLMCGMCIPVELGENPSLVASPKTRLSNSYNSEGVGHYLKNKSFASAFSNLSVQLDCSVGLMQTSCTHLQSAHLHNILNNPTSMYTIIACKCQQPSKELSPMHTQGS
jgi:hypothetical protein